MIPFLENRLLSLELYFMCLEYISLKNIVALSGFILHYLSEFILHYLSEIIFVELWRNTVDFLCDIFRGIK